MKKYFFTGLITLLPLTLTILIAIYLIDLFTAPFVGMVEHFLIAYEHTVGISFEKHHTTVLILSRILVLILLFFFIVLLGFLGRKFFFNTFMHLMHRLMEKIPFVRGIYRLCKEVTKGLFSENAKPFKYTALFPFPQYPSYAIGFVTGDVPPALKAYAKETDVAVFVCTAPHPLSGFILLMPKELVKKVDITTEEAFRFLVSCGVIFPGYSPELKPPESKPNGN